MTNLTKQQIDEIVNSIENNPEQAIDEVDNRDYSYSDIYWDLWSEESEFNKKLVAFLRKGQYDNVLDFLRDKLIIQNQGADAATKLSCTRQGMVNIENAQNLIEYGIAGLKYVQRNAKERRVAYEQWRYERYGIKPRTKWASLQSAVDESKNLGHIDGYAKVYSVEETIQAINRLHFIYTWSSNGDRRHTVKTWVYRKRSDNKFVGHAFVWAFAYDLEGKFFRACNSYGPENGFFKIPFSEWSGMYSRYAIIDKVDAAFIAYKQEKELARQRVIDQGISNGKDGGQPVTREQLRVMLYRQFGQ